jgi:outer membrane lipoprotein-sorting protein
MSRRAMKDRSLLFPLVVTCVVSLGMAPQKPAASTLESLLGKMDAVAANFSSAQAEFEWDRYEKVIDEVDDVQTGTIYYRRSGKQFEMMVDSKKDGPTLNQMKPEPKYVLFKNGQIRMYLPKVDQVTVYHLGKNSSDFESYLVLGFGGSGQDLKREFDLTDLGPETVLGVSTVKLQLVPKSESVRNKFNRIILWIDAERGISVQQQFFEPAGNYRLAKYTQIRLNEKIKNEVFHLKTTSKTQVVTPNG